jgi:hypothetical protein
MALAVELAAGGRRAGEGARRAVGEGEPSGKGRSPWIRPPVDAALLAMDAAASELGAGAPELLLEGVLEGPRLRAPSP